MDQLPIDIVKKVRSDFQGEDQRVVFEEFSEISNETLNVGLVQLLRAILVLSRGDILKLLEFREKRYRGDPRDVISMANSASPQFNSGLEPFGSTE